MKHSWELLLAVIWITLTNVPSSTAIRCYKCSLTKTTLYLTESWGLCSEFDYSARFIVDCPESTFCVKKTYKARIAGPINGTDRYCAYQKFETHRVINGKWTPQVIIEEPYSENCTVINDQGLRTGWTQECYCKTDLCNGEIHYKKTPHHTGKNHTNSTSQHIRNDTGEQHIVTNAVGQQMGATKSNMTAAGYNESSTYDRPTRSLLLLLLTVIVLINIPLIG